jgi:hypothetical protein
MRIERFHVSFEQSMRLKLKGFDLEVISAWEQSSKDVRIVEAMYSYDKYQDWNKYSDREFPKYNIYYSCPEYFEVIEWFRIKHGIWICVDFSEVDESFTYKIHLIKSDKLPRIFTDCGYESPQEATSAAINYVLDKLI